MLYQLVSRPALRQGRRVTERLVIPGVLVRSNPAGDAIPVVYDSPHSGRDYPREFLAALTPHELRQGEDAWVDELFAAAPESGAVLLAAQFPRSFIDVNRGVGEIDVSLLGEPWPHPITATDKVAAGVGLIWKMIGPGRPIYQRKLEIAEVRGRIENFYNVYSGELDAVVERLHRQWGAVWHVNCHSMASLNGLMAGDQQRPDFCIGTLDGSSCDREFAEVAIASLRHFGYRVTVNDPFKGAELVRRIGNPGRGRHSLQIEINRRLYMDESTLRKHAGFDRVKVVLGHMIQAIGGLARARLKDQPRLAAE
jgi:N-formylglutamate deformylase